MKQKEKRLKVYDLTLNRLQAFKLCRCVLTSLESIYFIIWNCNFDKFKTPLTSSLLWTRNVKMRVFKFIWMRMNHWSSWMTSLIFTRDLMLMATPGIYISFRGIQLSTEILGFFVQAIVFGTMYLLSWSLHFSSHIEKAFVGNFQFWRWQLQCICLSMLGMAKTSLYRWGQVQGSISR